MIMTQALREFFLSEDIANFTIKNDDSSLVAKPLWVSVGRHGNFHLALALGLGQTALGPLMQFYRDMSMSCEFGSKIDEKNDEGFSFQAFFEPEDGSARIILFEAPLSRANGESNFTLDLSVLRSRRGSLGLRCFSPSGRLDLASKLAVVKWVVGPNDRISLLTARRHRSRRIKTTIESFNAAYDHEMYAHRKVDDRQEGASGFTPLQKAPSGPRTKSEDPITAESLLSLSSAKVAKGEDVYRYAHRVLCSLIPTQPNFPERIRFLHEREDRPVRILSLCSGAASIEWRMIADADCPVEITLFDLNENLMRKAEATLSSVAQTSSVLGDINVISAEQFGNLTFDVAMFVSGLHHVVEIERVLQTVIELLVPNGEFWIIGEAIGRNGNQLWPEALDAANRIFSLLPERFRRNASTGNVDSTVPETDFSASSFEGIRSEEIEPLLLRYFDPVQLWRRNCFLWRLVNPVYFRNYDLNSEEDRYVVLSLVAAEYNLWKKGGRPAESHSIYRRRENSFELRQRPAITDIAKVNIGAFSLSAAELRLQPLVMFRTIRKRRHDP
jgi:SAM-dependent methyltransferase